MANALRLFNKDFRNERLWASALAVGCDRWLDVSLDAVACRLVVKRDTRLRK